MVPLDTTLHIQYEECACSSTCGCDSCMVYHKNAYSTEEESIHYTIKYYSSSDIKKEIWKWLDLDTTFARCFIERKIVPVKNIKPFTPFIRRTMNSISGMKGIALQKKLNRR